MCTTYSYQEFFYQHALKLELTSNIFKYFSIIKIKPWVSRFGPSSRMEKRASWVIIEGGGGVGRFRRLSQLQRKKKPRRRMGSRGCR